MAWSLVQQTGGNTDGPTSSITIQFASNVVANNRIIVSGFQWGGLPPVLSDNAGNSYTVHISQAGNTGGMSCFIGSAVITAGAGTRISVTVATTGGVATASFGVTISEVSGLSTTAGAGAIDVTQGADNNTSGSTTLDTGTTAATSAANELAWAACCLRDSQAPTSVTSGWTHTASPDDEVTGSSGASSGAHKDSGASGSTLDCVFTYSSITWGSAAVVVFKLPTAAVTTPFIARASRARLDAARVRPKLFSPAQAPPGTPPLVTYAYSAN